MKINLKIMLLLALAVILALIVSIAVRTTDKEPADKEQKLTEAEAKHKLIKFVLNNPNLFPSYKKEEGNPKVIFTNNNSFSTQGIFQINLKEKTYRLSFHYGNPNKGGSFEDVHYKGAFVYLHPFWLVTPPADMKFWGEFDL